MATAINQLTDGNEPDPSDLLVAERENRGTYSGIKLTAENLVKSFLAGRGVNLADYYYSYIRSDSPSYPLRSCSEGSVQYDSSGPANGYYLKHTASAEDSTITMGSQVGWAASFADYPITIKAGQILLFSLWVKAESETDITTVRPGVFFRHDDTVWSFTSKDITPTTEWVRYAVIISPNFAGDPLATKAQIRLQIPDGIGCTLYYAGIMLEEYQGNGVNTDASAYIPPVYIPE